MIRLFDKSTGVIFFVALLFIWQLLSILGMIDLIFLPSPVIILSRAEILLQSDFYRDLFTTLYRLLGGFFLGTIIGIPLGIAVGINKYIAKTLGFTIEFLRPIPASALVPLGMVLFGLGNGMTLFIITYAVIWPILINTIDGVHGVDPILIDTGKIFNLTKKQILTQIIIPASMPNIFTGMRISLAVSIVLVIVVEMLVGNVGLGYRLITAERTFQFADMYFIIILTGLLGIVLNYTYIVLTNKFILWHVVSKNKNL